jgi:alkanesulfonate monooxygenase
LNARLIEYPEPASEMNGSNESGMPMGIRIGILARDTHDEAWSEAYSRFPKSRAGALTHQLAQKSSDSNWHRKLSERGNMITDDEPVYWLGPFQHYQTFCPYLVGDHKEVTAELSHYLKAGCRTCILDIPVSGKELKHTQHVFRQAEKGVVSCT